MQQKITIEDITSKEFKKIGTRGYDAEEVDNFLDDICDQMERDEQQMKEMQRQLTEARTQLSAAREEAQSLTAQLREAQSALASAPAAPVQSAPAALRKDDPNEEAVGVLAMAQQMKQQILADAQAQAETIMQEAESRARERLGSLVDDKEAAERQLAALKETIGTYRSRFTEMVKAQQSALDALEDL